eukprot:13867082-Heterocapsa_arctica.AAC.1
MPIMDKSGREIIHAFAKDWIRHHGPPKAIQIDMEGGIHSNPAFGSWLERMGAKLNAVGNTQGLVEPHIGLLK